jgi:hypothetical protein
MPGTDQPKWDSLSWLKEHWAIVCIMVAFVVLGMRYSLTTPLFEIPDEPRHYLLVESLAYGRSLPTSTVLRERWPLEDLHQPPLYHAVGAMLTRVVGQSADDVAYEPNPHAVLGQPGVQGNKNALLHMGDDDLPYHGLVLVVHVLRVYSVLCATLTVLLTYLITGQVIGSKWRTVALAAAALVAFNPQFLFGSAGATNEGLGIALVTLVLYLALCVSWEEGYAYRSAIILGVSAGAAALAHPMGLAALLLIPCAYACAAPQERSPWRARLRSPLMAMGIALAISGWWYVGHASALSAHVGGVGLAFALQQAFRSYWGLFGWGNVPAGELFYAGVGIVSIIGAGGVLLLLAGEYWRRGKFERRRFARFLLPGVWTLLVVGVKIWRACLGAQVEGRTLFSAISVISLTLVLGLWAWIPRRYGRAAALVLCAGLFGLALVVPSCYITPAYARPETFALEEVPFDIRDLDIAYGDALFLLGYSLERERVTAGEGLPIKLYWVARKRMIQDYTISLRLLGRQGEQIGALDTFPGGGNYPTRLWLPGEVVCDEYIIPIAQDARVPTAGAIRVGVYAGAGNTRLPAFAHGESLDRSPEIARVSIGPPVIVSYRPQHPLWISLDRKVVLIGYDLYPEQVSPGEEWEITLYWQAQRRMGGYTVFVHLVNDAGEIVAQVDEKPLGGDYPTQFWQIGEEVQDAHRLSVPGDLLPGEYNLDGGLYVLETGERLPIVGAEEGQTHFSLGSLTVSPDGASR